MIEIHFHLPDGSTRTLNGTPGLSLMEVARDADIPGITADCGGACSCATCHVMIDPQWHDRLPAPEAQESEILEFAPDVDPERSRLSCQIPVTVALNGLEVTVPQG